MLMSDKKLNSLSFLGMSVYPNKKILKKLNLSSIINFKI